LPTWFESSKIGDPTLFRDKANLKYISGGNPHLTSRFVQMS